MKFQEALEIILCLADQGSLDENHVDDEQREELERQNEAFGVMFTFQQNCRFPDLSEFDADDEQDQQPSED